MYLYTPPWWPLLVLCCGVVLAEEVLARVITGDVLGVVLLMEASLSSPLNGFLWPLYSGCNVPRVIGFVAPFA